MKQYPKLKPISIRRLLKIREDILAEPKVYDQWDPFVPKPNCGTSGCILGFAMARFGNPTEHYVGIRDGIRLLRLTEDQSETLYGAWPRVWKRRLNLKTRGSKAAARVAAQYIDRFIKTGGTMQ